jgi:hypothetical protein
MGRDNRLNAALAEHLPYVAQIAAPVIFALHVAGAQT